MVQQFSAQLFPSLTFARAARWLAVAVGFVIALSAAQSLAQSRESLGAGDTLRITVFQNPDLTTEARISDGLKKGNFMKDPQVTVSVLTVRSRQVSVLGHVVRPGRYPLDEVTTSITDVLALAGGIAPTGDEVVTAVVTRDGKATKAQIDVAGMYRSGDMKSNFQVQAGDTIFVQRAPVFYIYGEVTRSGSYRLEPNMAVVQALSLGGGLTPRGTERGLTIHRRGPDGTLQKIGASLSDSVRADDVIYVRESLF